MVPRGGVAIDGLLHGLTHLTAPWPGKMMAMVETTWRCQRGSGLEGARRPSVLET